MGRPAGIKPVSVIGAAATVAAFSILFAFTVGWGISHARGADAPAAPKLTILDCQTILGGLTALDGRTEMTKDGTAATISYQFGSARLRLTIQQNMAALNVVQQDFVKGMQALFKEITGEGGTEIKQNTPEMARYNKQFAEAQQLPCSASLTRIKADDLKLDKNEIPGSVLAALDKILDR